uniref:Uncharacterized protein n=1 Tax=Oryza barthii TaxID=65489 RepID=A0A0D3HV20_9ORYZ
MESTGVEAKPLVSGAVESIGGGDEVSHKRRGVGEEEFAKVVDEKIGHREEEFAKVDYIALVD